MPRSMLFWVVVSLSHLTKCAYVCLPLSSRFSYSGLSIFTTGMVPPAEAWCELPRTPYWRSSTSENSHCEQ